MTGMALPLHYLVIMCSLNLDGRPEDLLRVQLRQAETHTSDEHGRHCGECAHSKAPEGIFLPQ